MHGQKNIKLTTQSYPYDQFVKHYVTVMCDEADVSLHAFTAELKKKTYQLHCLNTLQQKNSKFPTDNRMSKPQNWTGCSGKRKIKIIPVWNRIPSLQTSSHQASHCTDCPTQVRRKEQM